MKAKIVTYSIEDPCHEDWGKMNPEAQGRFCSSCRKTVVDFSSMSDFSIVSYMEAKKGEAVCGRFRPNQMEKAYSAAIPHRSLSFDLKAVALGLALTTFSAIHADAQVTEVDTTRIIQEEPLDGMVVVREYVDHSDEKYASGTILVEGKACGFAIIRLMNVGGDEILTISSDKDGRFKIPLDWSKSKDPHSLIVSGAGLISGTVIFSETESITDMKITLYREEMMLKGKVISR